MVEEGSDALLAQQVAYYRAAAAEYLDGPLDLPGGDELAAAIGRFALTGQVLELACGPGTWTPQLLRRASTVTAIDAAPEMLALARRRLGPAHARAVRFVRADLFNWQPDRRYDGVFFGFWLSHVPWDRFDAFWAMLEQCLMPDGRVLFVDDDYRTGEELIHGAASTTIQRRLRDGTTHRAVKVPHSTDGLEQRLRARGWDITVHPTSGPFYWGEGRRQRRTPHDPT